MKVTEIPTVASALGTILKGLVRAELEIGGRVETIQTTAVLRLARILRRVKKIKKFEETCCHADSSESPSANSGVKNSQ